MEGEWVQGGWCLLPVGLSGRAGHLAFRRSERRALALASSQPESINLEEKSRNARPCLLEDEL